MGEYAVTFNVAAATGFNAAAGLKAGTMSIVQTQTDGSLITMTATVDGTVSINIRGSGVVTIDWGDGTAPKSHELSPGGYHSHTYTSGQDSYSIRIEGPGVITVFECDVSYASTRLTSLDVTGAPALVSLSCRYSLLTSLDVSKNTVLETLNCGANQITSLDVSGAAALVELDCSYNNLTSLDVSNNSALVKLICGSGLNQITSLDVSTNTALEYLSCSGNQLTSLDVSNNPVLENLACDGNELTRDALINIFNSLPDWSGDATVSGHLPCEHNPGYLELTDTDKSIVTGKDWTFSYY